MKPKLLATALLITLTAAQSFGQGALTPPAGPPAPAMKSLQEIWDKIGAVETRATTLENQNAQLQRQLGLIAASTVNFAWVVTTIGNGLHPSLAFGPDGHPAIAYAAGQIFLARFDGTVWTSTAVPGAEGGANPSLAFGSDGYPAIAYGGNRLRYARFDGASWSTTVVDNSGYASAASLAFGRDGLPGIAYMTTTSNGKYASFDGTAWSLSMFDSTDFGNHTSLAFAPDGRPFISYRAYGQTFNGGYVKLARRNGAVWTTSIAATDQTPLTSVPTALAFGPDGQPAIAYGDQTAQRVYVTRYNGTIWTATTVAVAYGDYYSLAFAPDGQPALAFLNVISQDLLFHRYAGGLDGPAWVGSVVEAAGDVGYEASLAFGPDGQPAIAYMDNTTLGTNILKFARKGVFKPLP